MMENYSARSLACGRFALMMSAFFTASALTVARAAVKIAQVLAYARARLYRGIDAQLLGLLRLVGEMTTRRLRRIHFLGSGNLDEVSCG